MVETSLSGSGEGPGASQRPGLLDPRSLLGVVGNSKAGAIPWQAFSLTGRIHDCTVEPCTTRSYQ